MSSIRERVQTIADDLPPHVMLVAAAKTRTPAEVCEVIDAGVRTVGHNYVQEADEMIRQMGQDVAHWTLIGHLQRNKAKAAVRLFDSIQTVDSLRLAEAITRACHAIGRTMPVLVEINAAREPQKAGVAPEDTVDLIREIARLGELRIDGLMTMGPWVEDAEALRPLFREVRALFERVRAARIPGVSMHVLSMGMSDSYAVAVDEGSTMIRVGSALFGPRSEDSKDAGETMRR
jgi:hypothetical protein